MDRVGRRAYAFNQGSSNVTVIDVAGRAAAGTIPTDGAPARGALNRTGDRMYVVSPIVGLHAGALRPVARHREPDLRRVQRGVGPRRPAHRLRLREHGGHRAAPALRPAHAAAGGAGRAARAGHLARHRRRLRRAPLRRSPPARASPPWSSPAGRCCPCSRPATRPTAPPWSGSVAERRDGANARARSGAPAPSPCWRVAASAGRGARRRHRRHRRGELRERRRSPSPTPPAGPPPSTVEPACRSATGSPSTSSSTRSSS